MIKKSILAFFITILFGSISFAQNSYNEGFIIKSTGDTTFGLIRYRPLKYEGAYLDFKETKKADPTRLLKNELLSFSYLDGRVFRKLDLSSITEYAEMTLVEVLVEGELSLYKAHHGYILQRTANTTHLSFLNSPKNKLTNGALQNVNIKKLGLFFSVGCSEPLLGGLGYKNSDRSLINLVKAFSDCQDTPYQVYGPKVTSAQISFGPVVGFNSSNLVFGDENFGFPEIQIAEFNRSNTILFGFEYNSTLGKISKNLSLTAGLYYMQNNFYGSYSRERSVFITIEEDFFFEASHIKPVIGLGYQVLGDKFPLILSGGFLYNVRSEKRSIRFRYQTNIDPLTNLSVVTSTSNSDDEWMLNTNSLGYWLGISSKLNLTDKHYLGVQFRYENSGRINLLPSNTKSLQLMLSLMFKK